VVEGGTAEILSLKGQGGNLENDAPLPTGALRLTTTDNPDKADVGRAVGNPIVGDAFNETLSLSFSIFKEDTSNDFAAPALKLGFFNGDFGGDGFVQLIFEPTWNIVGSEGASSAVPTGEWLTFDISLDSGLFWNTGGFGQANSAGGPPLLTLQEWLDTFDDAFADAIITSLGIGQGSFNADTVGYVDSVNVTLGNTSFSTDFEIPAPATLALFGMGLLGAGVAAGRRRRRG